MMTSADILMTIQRNYIQEYHNFLYWRLLAERGEDPHDCHKYYAHRLDSLRSLCEKFFSDDDMQLMYERALESIAHLI